MVKCPTGRALQKVSNLPHTCDYSKNFPLRQTVYWNVNILLNTSEISKVSVSCLIKVCSFKYKIIHSRKSTLNGLLQRLSNDHLKQDRIKEQWPVNAVHMLNVERITKSFCGGLILDQIPHCMEQNSCQMPRVYPGGG